MQSLSLPEFPASDSAPRQLVPVGVDVQGNPLYAYVPVASLQAPATNGAALNIDGGGVPSFSSVYSHLHAPTVDHTNGSGHQRNLSSVPKRPAPPPPLQAAPAQGSNSTLPNYYPPRVNDESEVIMTSNVEALAWLMIAASAALLIVSIKQPWLSESGIEIGIFESCAFGECSTTTLNDLKSCADDSRLTNEARSVCRNLAVSMVSLPIATALLGLIFCIVLIPKIIQIPRYEQYSVKFGYATAVGLFFGLVAAAVGMGTGAKAFSTFYDAGASKYTGYKCCLAAVIMAGLSAAILARLWFQRFADRSRGQIQRQDTEMYLVSSPVHTHTSSMTQWHNQA